LQDYPRPYGSFSQRLPQAASEPIPNRTQQEHSP
jgi:hypothetical protein